MADHSGDGAGGADSIDWFSLVSNMMGGMALFLYGIGRMTYSLKMGAGDVMRDVLKRMCKNQFLGMLTGIFVTAILSSSSAASVMLVTFVESGYITFAESIGALLGVNIGTTITVYLVALNITKYCLGLIAAGYAVSSFSAKGSKSCYLGEALFGLGLLFFGIDIMGDAMSPLRNYTPFLTVLMSLDNVWMAIIASTIFTLVIQSVAAAAVLSIVVLLSQQGFLSQSAGVAMVLGANIGTTGTALLSSIGKQTESVRVAVCYFVLKAFGVVAIAPFVSWFVYLIYALQGTAFVDPKSKAERAEHVPGIITFSHSLFNVALALIFLPFTSRVAKVVEFLVPSDPTLGSCSSIGGAAMVVDTSSSGTASSKMTTKGIMLQPPRKKD